MESVHFHLNYLSQNALFLRDISHKTQSCYAKISQVAQLVFTSLTFKSCCSYVGLIKSNGDLYLFLQEYNKLWKMFCRPFQDMGCI